MSLVNPMGPRVVDGKTFRSAAVAVWLSDDGQVMFGGDPKDIDAVQEALGLDSKPVNPEAEASR